MWSVRAFTGGIITEYCVQDAKKDSTQALKSGSSYLNGEADKKFKGELKRKCKIIVKKCNRNDLDEKVQIKVLYLEHFCVLHGFMAATI